MGLFGERLEEKMTCSLCGGKSSLFSGVALKDGRLCGDCTKRLRGVYDVEHWLVERDDGSVWQKDRDTLLDVTVAQVRKVVDEAERTRSQALEEMGEDFTALFRVEEAFTIAPKLLEVGIWRFKLLRNRRVVKGLILSGTFTKDDRVTLLHGEEKRPTTLLAVYKCSVSDFATELGADFCRTASAPQRAWLILDDTVGEAGDTVGIEKL